MSERKNIKRNKTRPKVSQKPFVQSMQRNYSKKKKVEEQPSLFLGTLK